MDRRSFVAATLALLAAPLAPEAQPARISRIGVLNGDFPNSPCLDAASAISDTWKGGPTFWSSAGRGLCVQLESNTTSAEGDSTPVARCNRRGQSLLVT